MPFGRRVQSFLFTHEINEKIAHFICNGPTVLSLVITD